MRSMRFGARSRQARTRPPASARAAAALATAGAARDRRSIVVLPFANLSPDADNAYFSDGLTEELIADLAKVNALQVISRTSSMQLKGTKKSVRTIGQELGVHYVLEGSVRKAGNSLRITAQLIDVATDAPLWSDKYSGTMDDVFEVQERVSREIVKALGVRLTSDEIRRLADRPIADPRAFELYLQARQQIRRYAIPRPCRSWKRRFASRARRRRSWRCGRGRRCGRCASAWRRISRRWMRPSARRDRCSPTSGRAVRACAARQSQVRARSSARGLRNFRRAVELEPNDTDSLVMMAFTLVGAGQDDAAQALAPRLMQCDPLSAATWMAAGGPLWFVGRAEQGIPIMQRGIEIDPDNFVAHWCLGYACAVAGRLDDAKEHGARIRRLFDGSALHAATAVADRRPRRPRGGRARAARSINVAVLDPHQQFHLAESFIVAGDLERGLEFLERSVAGFHPYVYMANHCRFLDPVRHLPRFQAVLEQAKERTEAFRRLQDW